MHSVRWLRRLKILGLLCGGGLVFQATSCSLDPDLILQAATQFFVEFATFVTDSALVNLR
jgi:hypothetical protein